MNKGSQEDIQSAVGRTIERVARESYGRLVAYLSVHTHDLASAEDALSEALVSALRAWPRDGLPQNPEAWLLTAARHALIDVIRHQHVVLTSEPTLALLKEDSPETNLSAEFPDERLKLLFVCAHPAIDPAMHTPLMLQTVLGLDATRIAHAFLVPPKTMGQRLFRAKTKIRDGGIQFEIPQERDLPERLDAVLEAIYAAFGIGWDDMLASTSVAAIWPRKRSGLRGFFCSSCPSRLRFKACWLSCCTVKHGARHARALDRPLHSSFRAGPEAMVTSFNGRGRTSSGRSFQRGSSGRFQLEAAIQSVHAERARHWPDRLGGDSIVLTNS